MAKQVYWLSRIYFNHKLFNVMEFSFLNSPQRTLQGICISVVCIFSNRSLVSASRPWISYCFRVHSRLNRIFPQ